MPLSLPTSAKSPLLLALVLSLFLAGAIAANELPKARTMLVVDASGSMWQKVDGEYKIVIARRVIDELMGDWDPEIPLGLSAYGHNQQGSCTDIETLVTPAPGTGRLIAETVNGLTPAGKTPLTRAVIQAAETLEYKGRPASVVLLTDGEETCGMDPCAMGAALEERGIDFTVYVIGFSVALADQGDLRCMAESTGGQFIAANNGSELAAALANIRESVETSAATEPEQAEPASTLRLRAHMTANERITDEAVQWDVRPVDADGLDDPARSVRSSGSTLEQPLPAGRFRIYMSYGGAFKYVDITATPGENQDFPVVLDAGRLRISPQDIPDGTTVRWSAYPLESNREEGRLRATTVAEGSAELILNAGLYRIKGEAADFAPVAFDVLIAPGGTISREPDLSPR